MKRLLATTLCALLAVAFLGGCTSDVDVDESSCTTSTQNYISTENVIQQKIQEIEQSYKRDSTLPEYTSTIGMVQLEDNYREKWKQLADEYYNKLMAYDRIVKLDDHDYSSEDFHGFIENMKADWEQHYDVRCENYVEMLKFIYGSGTIVGPLFAHYKCELQKDWTLELLGICTMLSIE